MITDQKEYINGKSSTDNKKKYNRRTVAAGTISRRRVVRTITTTCRRRVHNKKDAVKTSSSTTNQDVSEGHNPISILVPPSIPSDWLIQKSVIILIKYLLYARGLFPMTIDQLFSYNVDQQIYLPTKINGTLSSPSSSFKISPSLRRKVRKARQEVCQLLDDWNSIQSWLSIAIRRHELSTTTISPGTTTLQSSRLVYVVISLGRSYSQCSELYLVDVHSSDSEKIQGNKSSDNHDQHMEQMLTRRLLSTLMNNDDDDQNNKSPLLQELPSRSSPSFRLYLTLGVIIGDDNVGDSNKNDVVFSNSNDNITSSHHQVDQTVEGFNNIDWIHRHGLPLSRTSCHTTKTSRKQGVTTIQLQRRNPNIDRADTTEQSQKNLFQPTSEKITWISLPNNIRGFRL